MDVRYVRVKNGDGVFESVPQKKYESRPDRYELVNEPATDRGGNPLPPVTPGGTSQPALNGSTDDWRAYGLAHGLSPEQVEQMSRDDLVRHFNPEEN